MANYVEVERDISVFFANRRLAGGAFARGRFISAVSSSGCVSGRWGAAVLGGCTCIRTRFGLCLTIGEQFDGAPPPSASIQGAHVFRPHDLVSFASMNVQLARKVVTCAQVNGTIA